MKTDIKIAVPNEITITCPNCDAEVPLSEAVIHRFREQLQTDFELKRKQQEKLFTQREKELSAKQEQVESAQKTLDKEVKTRLEGEKAKLRDAARKEAEEEIAVKLCSLQQQLDSSKQKVKESQKKELELLTKKAALEQKHQELELELQRKLDEERGKIIQDAKAQAAQEHQLKLAEKDKVVVDLQKQIKLLEQKASQGSQQLQGEVLELQLEAVLKAQFPHDEIVPVANGARGADLLQKVRTNSGMECGTIIWESKRTRAWSDAWSTKLKENQRSAGADIAVILTQALPKDIKCFGCFDGVWVSDLTAYVGLVTALRQGLVATAHERQAATGKNEKKEILYRYLCGVEFRQRIEAIVEAFVELREGLDSERDAMARIWAARLKHINKALAGAAGMYGDVQGIIGQKALPEIKVLQLRA